MRQAGTPGDSSLLGIIAELVPFSKIQKIITGITEYSFKLARLHVLKYSRGAQVPMRVDESQLDHFLSFITSPHVVQDLPFGLRYLHLSKRTSLGVSKGHSVDDPTRIITQFIQFCKEGGVKPLSPSTMLIYSICLH